MEDRPPHARSTSETVTWASSAAIVAGGLLTSFVWGAISPTPIAVFSALVQTGVTTRLVLVGLLFGCGAALFAFRTWNQIWYGHAVCVVAVAVAWEMLRRLAIQIQPADVIGLALSLYLLVRGLVDVQEGIAQAKRR